jgi:hypothetical protein
VKVIRRYVPFILIVVVVSGCNRTTTPIPIPSTLVPPTTTDSFSGTLKQQGSNLHSFQVCATCVVSHLQETSEVDVTLTSLMTVAVPADPNADPPVVGVPAVPVAVPVTIRVGQPTLTTLGVQCSNLMSVVAPAGALPQLKGQALNGAYCVSISDPDGVLTSAVTYTITVAHG